MQALLVRIIYSSITSIIIQPLPGLLKCRLHPLNHKRRQPPGVQLCFQLCTYSTPLEGRYGVLEVRVRMHDLVALHMRCRWFRWALMLDAELEDGG